MPMKLKKGKDLKKFDPTSMMSNANKIGLDFPKPRKSKSSEIF